MVAPTPTQVAPAPQVQAQMGVQGYQSAPYSVQPPATTGESTSGEPIQGRVQQGGRTPEFTSPFRSRVTVSGKSSNRAGQLRIPTNNPVQQSGSAALYAFEQQQPGILQQLFPNFSGTDRGSTSSKRGKSS